MNCRFSFKKIMFFKSKKNQLTDVAVGFGDSLDESGTHEFFSFRDHVPRTKTLYHLIQVLFKN